MVVATPLRISSAISTPTMGDSLNPWPLNELVEQKVITDMAVVGCSLLLAVQDSVHIQITPSTRSRFTGRCSNRPSRALRE